MKHYYRAKHIEGGGVSVFFKVIRNNRVVDDGQEFLVNNKMFLPIKEFKIFSEISKEEYTRVWCN